MMRSHCHPLLVLLLLALSWQLASAWDYSDLGRSWATSDPQFCSGRRQSPIDLGVRSSQQDNSLGAFVFDLPSPDTNFNATVKNTGYSVKLSWSSDYVVRMGLANGSWHYTAEQLHYHWGSDSSRGSEHTLDGRSFAAEAHLVFYNSRDYASFSDAAAKPNGLAVLGVFLEESSSASNQLLEQLESLIDESEVQPANGVVSESMNASDLNVVDLLLPRDRSSYYRYAGSLTTPPCLETVMWTVFKDPMPISAEQLAMLRSLRDVDNATMQNNYRVVQPLNPRNTDRPGARRELYRSFSSGIPTTTAKPTPTAGVTAAASAITVAAAAAVAAAAWRLLPAA